MLHPFLFFFGLSFPHNFFCNAFSLNLCWLICTKILNESHYEWSQSGPVVHRGLVGDKNLVRIPPYENRIKRAAELRTTLSQQRWGPTKWVIGVTKAEDEAPHKQKKIGKQSVILRSYWYNIIHSLLKYYALLGVMHMCMCLVCMCSACMQSTV